MEPERIHSEAETFFRRKFNPTLALLAGILLFLLPFAELKCGPTSIAENSGIGLAIGKDWKISLIGGYENYIKKDQKFKKEKRSMMNQPNYFIILSLFFAFCGIILSVSNWNFRILSTMSASLLAMVLLLAAMIYLKILFRSQMRSSGNEESLKISELIKIHFTIWYYLSLIAFASAAFFSYKHHKIELQDKINRVLDFEFQREEK